MKSSNKQVVQYNIYNTGNCYKIHGAFGIPQPTKNGADNIICRNKWNPNKAYCQINNGFCSSFFPPIALPIVTVAPIARPTIITVSICMT